jgi:TRAP-type C4-dicarboxylate transport system permease small subunit
MITKATASKGTREFLNKFSAVNSVVCRLFKYLAGFLMFGMLLVVFLQVVFRYVLNDSLGWTEEISKTLMVWMAFLVAPASYRAGANVSITIFIDALPAFSARLLSIVLNCLVLWIASVLFYYSFGFVERGMYSMAASLPLKTAWFYLVVPITLGVLVLVSLEQLLRDILKLIYPTETFTHPSSVSAAKSD